MIFGAAPAIGIEDIVWWTFISIVVVGILSLLWFAIGYAESKVPTAPPMAWNIVRLVFVLLCVFLLVCALMALIGKPLVRF